MRRVYISTVTVLTAALIVSCGGGSDQLTLQFQNFASPGTSQLDAVNATSAEVDVVQDACADGSAEPFQQTLASAIFNNQGASDIVLDTIVINIPNSGVPEYTRMVTQNLPGGQCENGTICTADSDCIITTTGTTTTGTCTHVDTTVTFLLFDVSTKLRVSPGTYDVGITFSGEDASGSRFTVPTNMTVTFEDFCHCAGGGCQL